MNQPLDSIFLGGGTPSLMGEQGLEVVLDALRKNFQWSDAIEATSEMNPESATEAVLQLCRAKGVNRISLGVQSFNDAILKGIDRIHDADGARRAVKRVRDAGFDNLSIDLIFGTPGQTLDIWREDLEAALALGTEHISLYGLTVDEGTPLESRVAEGLVEVAGEDLSVEMYELAIETLEAADFVHYEISNFARPGRESKHNRNYWLHGEYLGLGPAAHSHLAGERWQNVNELPDYLEVWWTASPDREFREEVERITPARRVSDSLILGLRMMAGVQWPMDLGALSEEERAEIESGIDRNLKFGRLEISGDRLRLTRKGLLLSNEVFADLILTDRPAVDSRSEVG